MSRFLPAALSAAFLLTLAACASGGDTATEPAGFDASAWTAEGAAALPDIPAGRYVDPRFFALEMEHIWRKSWLLAAPIV